MYLIRPITTDLHSLNILSAKIITTLKSYKVDLLELFLLIFRSKCKFKMYNFLIFMLKKVIIIISVLCCWLILEVYSDNYQLEQLWCLWVCILNFDALEPHLTHSVEDSSNKRGLSWLCITNAWIRPWCPKNRL